MKANLNQARAGLHLGAPRSISDQRVDEVTMTLEGMPKNATHWSTRGLAQRLG
jgi:hypothetical protein